jgi:hypothetical protein
VRASARPAGRLKSRPFRLGLPRPSRATRPFNTWITPTMSVGAARPEDQDGQLAERSARSNAQVRGSSPRRPMSIRDPFHNANRSLRKAERSPGLGWCSVRSPSDSTAEPNKSVLNATAHEVKVHGCGAPS